MTAVDAAGLAGDRLDELAALLEAATPGPWTYDPSEGDTVWDSDEHRPSIIVLTRDPFGNCEADAALIAALRNAAPALLAAARAHAALLADLHAVVEELEGNGGWDLDYAARLRALLRGES